MSENYESLGWKYKHAGEYKKAIRAFDKAIAHHQKTYFALHGKGECLLRTGEYTSALDCFKKAINIDKSHSWAYHGAGRAYHFLKQYDVALAYYNKSISINKRSTVAWHWKGRTLIQMGMYNDAINALETAMNNAVGGKHSGDQIPLIEQDLKHARDLREKTDKDTSKPIQITVQGDNNAPINVEGNQANDDAVINRSPVKNSGESVFKSDSSNESCSQIVDDELTNISHPGTGWTVPLPSGKKVNDNDSELQEKKKTGLISKRHRHCPDCGFKVKRDDMFCSNCGRKLV